MDIRKFIFESGITIARMARDIGYTQGHISGVIRGRIKPSKRFAEAVVQYTRGIVTEEEVCAGWEDPDDPLMIFLEKHAPQMSCK